MTDSAEEAVGITQFANRCAGFRAILKHRYADFKVYEVDLEGRVVRLTNLSTPQVASKSEEAKSITTAALDAASNPGEAVEAAVQKYAAISGATEAQLEPLRTFLRHALQHHANAKRPRTVSSAEAVLPPQPLVLEPAIAAKDQRTAVHRLLQSLPGFPHLETNTIELSDAAHEVQVEQQEKPGQHEQQGAAHVGHVGQQAQGGTAAPGSTKLQCIQVQVAGSNGCRPGQKRKWRDDSGWPGGSLRYTKFVLYKENMDSQQAISSLTKLLHVSHKLFAVAGTKDKRGVTVQQVTAFKLNPARLAGLNPRLRGMRVGNFEFTADQLRLGDLQGNRFELVLRAIEADSKAAVADAADNLRSSGFINYYGLQRFGTGAVPTHRVGQALLCGQWREAVRLLLTPREDCSRAEQVEACRLYLDKGDVEGALSLMPRFLVAEPTLLQGLKQHGAKGYLNALMMLPRNLRTMYIHAYQSYLWNSAASHRVQTYGASTVVAGDLVLPCTAAQGAAGRNRGGQRQGSAAAGLAAAAGAEVEQQPGAGAIPAIAQEGLQDDDLRELGAAEEVEVHVVTEAEAAADKWRIEDVVLPLPGHQVRYPEHSTADVYRQLAARDGVCLHSSPHGAKDFSMAELAGAYRPLLHRPADVQYELVRYSHPDADLASTDLMQLQGQVLPPPVAPGDEGGRCHLALRLAFTLPPSCYATMLIRELTKQPTSTAHHKGLGHKGDDTVSVGGPTPAVP